MDVSENDASTYRSEDNSFVEYDCDICGGTITWDESDDSWDRVLIKDCNCK